MYLDHVVAAYNATMRFPAEGYDQATIAAAEERLGVRFPAAYREFLLWNGIEFAPWNGDDKAVDLVPELQEWALETLTNTRHQLTIPPDALVFKQHGGYEINFFRLSEGDDPPVYYYSQTQEEPAFRCLAPHFSVFVMDALTYYLQHRAIALPPEGGEG